jgi:leucyl aminopeptidase
MIDVVRGTPDGADLLVVPVLADRTPGSSHEAMPDLEAMSDLLDAKDFTGAAMQLQFVATPDGPTPEALLVGLGEEVDAETLRRASGAVAKAAGRYARVATLLGDVGVGGADEAVALGTHLGAYRFDEYRSEPSKDKLASLVLIGDGDDLDIDRAAAVAKGVIVARDLVNRPAKDKPPAALADIASSLSADVSVTVYDEHDIAERGFGGLEAVNAGADHPARMVVLEYRPEDAKGTVVFVGKGIVFDSGGLSIKPASMMEAMKTDMAGAAAVYGAVQAIAELGLPVEVIGITPFTENMTGGSATRPGDVMRSYGGKTIEILNTDAEGRLVLADGLGLAGEYTPDLIVDIATLTGACKVALGTQIAGLFANDDEAAELVLAAGQSAGEKLWRLPLEAEYRKLVESDIADMKNTGGRYGGAITAALILSEFVPGDTPWVHLDIAGPGRVESADHYLSKGGSGFGVRTLVEVAATLAR